MRRWIWKEKQGPVTWFLLIGRYRVVRSFHIYEPSVCLSLSLFIWSVNKMISSIGDCDKYFSCWPLISLSSQRNYPIQICFCNGNFFFVFFLERNKTKKIEWSWWIDSVVWPLHINLTVYYYSFLTREKTFSFGGGGGESSGRVVL